MKDGKTPSPETHVSLSADEVADVIVNMRLADVQRHARIELASIRKALEAPPQTNTASLVQRLRGVAELKNPDTHEDFSVSIALDTLALLKGLCAEAADTIEGIPPQTREAGNCKE